MVAELLAIEIVEDDVGLILVTVPPLVLHLQIGGQITLAGSIGFTGARRANVPDPGKMIEVGWFGHVVPLDRPDSVVMPESDRRVDLLNLASLGELPSTLVLIRGRSASMGTSHGSSRIGIDSHFNKVTTFGAILLILGGRALGHLPMGTGEEAVTGGGALRCLEDDIPLIVDGTGRRGNLTADNHVIDIESAQQISLLISWIVEGKDVPPGIDGRAVQRRAHG